MRRRLAGGRRLFHKEAVRLPVVPGRHRPDLLRRRRRRRRRAPRRALGHGPDDDADLVAGERTAVAVGRGAAVAVVATDGVGCGCGCVGGVFLGGRELLAFLGELAAAAHDEAAEAEGEDDEEEEEKDYSDDDACYLAWR
jgi:hypothetical protein